jgi:hypothetical protein
LGSQGDDEIVVRQLRGSDFDLMNVKVDLRDFASDETDAFPTKGP